MLCILTTVISFLQLALNASTDSRISQTVDEVVIVYVACRVLHANTQKMRQLCLLAIIYHMRIRATRANFSCLL